MDAEYGQAKLQRPVYDEEHQQGIGSGGGAGLHDTIVGSRDVDDQGTREHDNPSLTQSFQRMAVSDQPENDKQTHQDEKLLASQDAGATGSHDQFSSEHTTGEASPNQDPKNQSYTTKISAAAAGLASTVYGKAANAGTLLKEKVAKPSGSPTGQQQTEQQLSDQSTEHAQQQPGYGQKVYAAIQPAKDRAAALASTAYEKAAGAGAAVKERTTGAAAGAADATKAKAAGAQERAGQTAAGAKSTIAEKLKPGEEEKALSQVISDMISSRKDTAKEKAGEARNIGAEKAAQAKEKAYEARNMGAEKAKEQTAVAKEKANELKGKTVEAKDVETEKAKEKAAHAREGTHDNATPMVDKIKGAVTSLFGTHASADDQAHAAVEQRSTEEVTDEKKI